MISGEKHFGPVWFIPGENRGKYPFCHSVFINGPGILIDPASNRERLKALRREQDVRQIWLSHWHEDHIKDLDLFDDLPLFISEADAPPLSCIEAFFAGYDLVEGLSFWEKFLTETFHFRPRTPAGYLAGGRRVQTETVTIDIIATAGHTPGHLSFYFHEPDVLLLGDYDLTPFGPWYGDRESSIEGTIDSIRHLQSLPAGCWLASHEAGIFEKTPDVLWNAYENVIWEREAKLLKALATPLTLEEITQQWIVYGKAKEPKELFLLGEKGIMGKHLQRLIREGKVTEDQGRFVRNL